MAIAFPGESGEYRAARDQLLDQEIELRRAMEAVAEARRRLDHGDATKIDEFFEVVRAIEDFWLTTARLPSG